MLPGLLCLLLWLCAAAAAGEEAPLCFRLEGTVETGRAEVPVRGQASRGSAETARMKPGDTCLILGEEESDYRVLFNGQVGYVSRRQIRVSAEKAAEPLPEAICDTVLLEEAVPSRRDLYLVLQGTVTAPEPLDTLVIYLWDERQFRVEYFRILTQKTPSASIPMDRYRQEIPLNRMEGGRKTLVIEGISGTSRYVLFRSPAYVRGRSLELPDVNDLCGGLPWQVLDTDVETAWTPGPDTPAVTFTVEKEAQAAIMTLEWKTIPEGFTVEMRDENNRLLSRVKKDGGYLADCVDLDPGARCISVIPDGAAELSTVRLYAEPYSRHVIQRWEPVPEKLDLLVISTHQDDEFLFFGGAIPMYAAREDVSMAVLYMVSCNRFRCREALDALWSAGLKKHPVFLNLPDGITHSPYQAREHWKKYQPLELLIGAIRKYRPEVILVQGFNGEYGSEAHKLTAVLTAEAVEKAAQEDADPPSAETFGVWQVKKLYVHLYEENQIHMDWNRPMDDTGVITPLFLAKEAFDRQYSQTSYFSLELEGVRYDNTLFGLYFTTVGEDVEKNDFLEHIR